FAGAAEKFRVAYELDADPGYLFDAAQAYRFAKLCAESADFYRRFLKTVPNAPNRDKVERFRDDMDACAKSQPLAAPDHVERPPRPPAQGASTEPVKDPPPVDSGETPADPGQTKRTVGLAVGAAGLVASGVGFYYMLRVFKIASDHDKCLHGQPACTADQIAD